MEGRYGGAAARFLLGAGSCSPPLIRGGLSFQRDSAPAGEDTTKYVQTFVGANDDYFHGEKNKGI